MRRAPLGALRICSKGIHSDFCNIHNTICLLIRALEYSIYMPLVPCKKCENSFYAKPSALEKGYGKYCSARCQYLFQKTGIELPCDVCGLRTYKQQKDLVRSKSKKFFCSKSCQTHWRNQLYIGERHKNFTTGESSYRAVMNRARIPKMCSLCKTTDSRLLAVHHIDKNRKNNKPENLTWLCHNCHFLVHHYESERVKFHGGRSSIG
jgi:hypothetical protein